MGSGGCKNRLEIISRIVVGSLFIFSGFVKSLDPMGSAIKFEEYFRIFSLQFLDHFSLALSIILCCFELVLGVAIVMGLYRRVAAYLTAATLAFFTILTLYLYIADPIESCGCFGEFFVMTNGQTFLKNVALALAAIPYLMVSFGSKEPNRHSFSIGSLVIAILLSLIAPIYAAMYLPIIDAMPYEIGADIRAKMSVPEGAAIDEYQTTLIYQNISDGKNVEFSVDDTQWHDSSKWSYVDTKTELVKRGYQPQISSFNVFDSNINDITDMVLDAESICLVVVNDIDISDKSVDNFQELYSLNRKSRVHTAVVTSLTMDQILDIFPWIDDRSIYFADATLLSTVMRAKVGVLMLENGIITDKFNLRRSK